jgi:hypothetical protein
MAKEMWGSSCTGTSVLSSIRIPGIQIVSDILICFDLELSALPVRYRYLFHLEFYRNVTGTLHADTAN